MASTPPAQIRAEARTPPTPLHGSAYHSSSPLSRYNTRSSVRKTPTTAESSFTQSSPPSRTPRSPRHSNLHFHSPNASATPKRKSSRYSQIISPTSTDDIELDDDHEHNLQPKPTYLSATTVFSEGMLPTPAKTPQKKSIPKSAMAARALFQDGPATAYDSPRKSKKKLRHNGFSLETVSVAPASQDIAIHVDSRDKVPEVDTSQDNPFYDNAESSTKKRSIPSNSSQRVANISKRRKIVPEGRNLDPQVQEAIRKDEGMVYVFRGKKVYRRFDDDGEEEEIIDPQELGLLEHQSDGAEIVKPLKTLTRKSIKPRKLFQPEQAPHQDDEEAETELEDDQDQTHLELDDHDAEPSPSRNTRLRAKPTDPDSTIDTSTTPGSKRKRTSPFDKWPRVKSSSISSISVPATRSRKRTAAEALEI